MEPADEDGREDMSGVYIKGMEIPKSGGISVYIWSSGTVDSANGIYKAISVPDHGRLIDADELKMEERWWDNDYAEDGYDHVIEIKDLENAPTIIPAD